MSHKPPRGVSVRRRDARLLRVVAHLQTGAALPTEFPAPLDGILASESRRRRLGNAYGGGARDHHNERIGLSTLQIGGPWFYLATTARPVGVSVEDVIWWHRRVRHERAERVCGEHLPPVIRDGIGAAGARRMPLVVTTAAALEWWAIGDPERVLDLAAGVPCVGKKRSQGQGFILRWDVEDHGLPEPMRVIWWDGLIGRPVPAAAGSWLGLDEVDTIEGALRPPYWRPPMLTLDGMTDRAWRVLIAPWTQAPQRPVGLSGGRGNLDG